MSYTLQNLHEGSDDSEPNVSGASSYSHAGMIGGCKRSADDAGLEPEAIGISSDDDGLEKPDPSKKSLPPNGKKTKGRVKIKMEFIDNKLRRYTTFSKRKTGIMKKAYELSTLTGTQVMLLVASETGHVYTFATRKLQPMITSEAGKALIQTCLNSPDPPCNQSQQLDQRMSATGFEETDLTYSINDEDQKWLYQDHGEVPRWNMPPPAPPHQSHQPPSDNTGGYMGDPTVGHDLSSAGDIRSNQAEDHKTGELERVASVGISILNVFGCGRAGECILEGKMQVSFPGESPIDSSNSPMSSTSQVTSANAVPVAGTLLSTQPPTKSTNISMQLPAGGYAAILTPGTLSHGASLQLATTHQPHQQQQHTSGQTLYRIPSSSLLSIPGIAHSSNSQSTNSNSESQTTTVTVVPTTQSGLSVMQGNMVIPAPTTVVSSGGSNSIPGPVIYQTAQGVVYATPTATLPEGVIFNFGQAPTALQIPSDQGTNATHQQYITIPVPVSLTAATQIVQSQQVLSPTTSSSSSEPSSSPGATDLSKTSYRK
uniref:Serum response factor homolog n=1 Tax=Strigamia maritima TaxID=126957 RepID=T1IPR1_STRMM